MDNDFKLYVDSQFTSPYAMSVFVTLTEKGIPFDIETVNLALQEHQQLDYSSSSLTCRVPMLTHGTFHLSESSAISEYLEELFPPSKKYHPVYPTDINERARARQVQAWLRSDLMPIREERSTEVVFLKSTSKPLSEVAQISVAKLLAIADKLLTDDSPNLFDQWCIADTDLAMMLNRLVLNGDEVPKKLATYARHQWQRSSVQLWINRDRFL